MNTICNLTASATCHQSCTKHTCALPGGVLTVAVVLTSLMKSSNMIPINNKNILSKKTVFGNVSKTSSEAETSASSTSLDSSSRSKHLPIKKRPTTTAGSLDPKLRCRSKLMESPRTAGRKTAPYLERPGGSWPWWQSHSRSWPGCCRQTYFQFLPCRILRG